MTTVSRAWLTANDRPGKWSRPVSFRRADAVLDQGVGAVSGVEMGELPERGSVAKAV
jgi:hypothetical protein